MRKSSGIRIWISCARHTNNAISRTCLLAYVEPRFDGGVGLAPPPEASARRVKTQALQRSSQKAQKCSRAGLSEFVHPVIREANNGLVKFDRGVSLHE
jgi:hypothetical protein